MALNANIYMKNVKNVGKMLKMCYFCKCEEPLEDTSVHVLQCIVCGWAIINIINKTKTKKLEWNMYWRKTMGQKSSLKVIILARLLLRMAIRVRQDTRIVRLRWKGGGNNPHAPEEFRKDITFGTAMNTDTLRCFLFCLIQSKWIVSIWRIRNPTSPANGIIHECYMEQCIMGFLQQFESLE